MKISTFLLSFLAAVTVCHSLPTASPLKGGLQDLLTASVELKSFGESFVQASENGLDADDLNRLKTSATQTNVKVRAAVEKIKTLLGVDRLPFSQMEVLKSMEKDIPMNNGTSIMSLLFSDSLMADDAKLQIFLQIIQKRMESLAAVIRRLRDLIDQPDEPRPEVVVDVAVDALSDQAAVFFIFGAAKDTFEDAEVVSRPLVRVAQEDGQENSRVRRSASTSGGGWDFARGRLTWRRLTSRRAKCRWVVIGYVYINGFRRPYRGIRCS